MNTQFGSCLVTFRTDPLGSQNRAWATDTVNDLLGYIRGYVERGQDITPAAAKTIQRWFECACEQLRRRAGIVPVINECRVDFYSGQDQRGARVAAIDVLNGTVTAAPPMKCPYCGNGGGKHCPQCGCCWPHEVLHPLSCTAKGALS